MLPVQQFLRSLSVCRPSLLSRMHRIGSCLQVAFVAVVFRFLVTASVGSSLAEDEEGRYDESGDEGTHSFFGRMEVKYRK